MLRLDEQDGCARCRANLYIVERHTVPTPAFGCVALCERCWSELTPDERLPYYQEYYETWKTTKPASADSLWADLKEAVLAGK